MSAPLDIRIIGNLSPPDWWTIGLTAAATVIGAIIGAGIAWLIAGQTAKENRGTRHDVEEAATLRAIVKFMELVNSVAGYYHGNEKTIANGVRAHQSTLETWVVMLPQIGRPQEVHIQPDDLIAFTKSREFGFITDLLNLCSQHNSMIYGVEAYGRRREELMGKLTPEMMDRYVAGASWDDTELRPLMPHILTIRDLAEALRTETRSLYEEALALQPRFGPIVRKYFKDPGFPIPGLVPGADPKNPPQQTNRTV